MEATSTVPESSNIQHAAAEETFDPLSDSIETNVAFVIEDSTVASPCMATTSTIQESYNMQHAVTEENFDPLSDSIETNVAVVIEQWAILNRVRVRVCVCRLNRVKDRVARKLLPLLGGAYRRVEHKIDAKSCSRAMHSSVCFFVFLIVFM